MNVKERSRGVVDRMALPAILAVAAAIRIWPIAAGVPHAVGIDGPAIIDRALRILNTGDWNTHGFDYPTLVIYLHAVAAILLFLGGAARGAWSSLSTFDIVAVYTTARLLTAAIAAGTVYLTYRVGESVGGRTLGLLAAAQMAVLPMHVRESHFALTDVPVTALTTAAVWLSMRAGTERTVRAYGVAGAVCGLAAAAKYNGVVACIAPLAAWVAHERAAANRLRKGVAAAASAAAAFLLTVPYALLDLPTFLTGFAAQGARFSGGAESEPAGVLYLKHLALGGRQWLPAAALGIAIVLARPSLRSRVWPLLAFGGAYFYTLATHGGVVFARYALPILPVVCVFAAVPVDRAWHWLERRGHRRTAGWGLAAGALALTAGFTVWSVAWGRQFAAPDTRQIAAEWMRTNLPRGARLAVGYGGPTYLRTLGFDAVEGLEHGPDWYRDQGIAYIVVTDPDRSREYLRAGPLVFAVAPAPTRWGPPIRIVRVEGAVQR